ncbi:unnamed protein product [Echinostoma caproni]|uniref:Neur_chan_LBD domain-containing protein n=1 Tax=Echinostoma caproni TaxID=27848 RepID=A0A183BE58_9TREM|nr:unnamed protein product [Echinostoma caproni]
MRMIFHTVLPVIIFIALVNGAKHWTAGERVQYLLAGYDPIGRPIRNATHIIQATIDVVLQQVVDLDEKNQILLTSLLIQLKWHDEVLDHRLRSLRDLIAETEKFTTRVRSDSGEDISDVGGLSFVLPPDRIWTPDLYVYNNAADGKKGMLKVDESRLRVNRRGKCNLFSSITDMTTDLV